MKYFYKVILIVFLFSLSSILAISFNLSSNATSQTQCGTGGFDSNQTAKVAIRADGTMLMEGESFFPFGFYHIPYGAAAGSEMETLKTIAAAGFNTFYAAVTPSIDRHEALLDEAEKLGVYMISANVSGRNIIEIVNRFKDKPALLGWRIADDVDRPRPQFSPQSLFRLHCQVKQADPNHITYISGYNEGITNYVGSTDAIGVQAYPIGRKGNQKLGWSYYLTSHTHRSVPKYRTVIANTQSFRWDTKNAAAARNPPIPSFLEVKNMTYQALLGGAKGVIYFAYREEDWHLKENEELWTGMKSLVPEIKAISPIILNGKLQPLKTRAKNVLAGIWIDKDKATIVALNTDYDKTTEVYLPLPLKSLNRQQLNSSEASGLTFVDGKANIVLNPLEVKTYSFDLGNNL